MGCSALRAHPFALIEPQLIENVTAARAGLARGKITIDLDEGLAVPLGLVPQLTAELSERRIVDRAGMRPATQHLGVGTG